MKQMLQNGSSFGVGENLPRAIGARVGENSSVLGTDPVRLIDQAEVARRLGISSSHLHNLRKTGRFGPKVIRLGRAVRFYALELAAWIEAGSPPLSRWDVLRNGQAKKWGAA